MIRFLAFITLSATVALARPEPASITMEWTIDGEKREAIVIPPSKKTDVAIPVVLVFHGHGGTMKLMERKGFQTQWPEALIVCPQGLPTVTLRDLEGKKAGWQNTAGTNKDRDLKFVDAILKTVRDKHKVDDARIYATGHSNGGGFTYLLLAERGKEFAAFAPTAATGGSVRLGKDVKPAPLLHVAGEKDEIVPFASQKRTLEMMRKLNGCDGEGKEWAKSGPLVGTLYPSKTGTPVVEVIHPGTHQYPEQAPELIVKFFKEQAKK